MREKKSIFLVTFILSEGKFFAICALSQYIAYILNILEECICFCMISRKLFHTTNQLINLNQSK